MPKVIGLLEVFDTTHFQANTNENIAFLHYCALCEEKPPVTGGFPSPRVQWLQWRHNGRDSVSNHQFAIVYSTVYSGVDHRKHQSPASLAFVRGIHRGPVNSPHKWPVTRTLFPFDDVIMVMPQAFSCHGVIMINWYWLVSTSKYPAIIETIFDIFLLKILILHSKKYFTRTILGSTTCSFVLYS